MDACTPGHRIGERSSGRRYCLDCHAARARARRAANPRTPKGRPSLHDRFWAKVSGGPVDECWEWLGAKGRGGYGATWVSVDVGRPIPAHRVAYELLIAEIPAGLELDHLCRNTSCVNPWHCDPVTRAVNLARTKGIPQPGKRGARGPHKNPRNVSHGSKDLGAGCPGPDADPVRPATGDLASAVLA